MQCPVSSAHSNEVTRSVLFVCQLAALNKKLRAVSQIFVKRVHHPRKDSSSFRICSLKADGEQFKSNKGGFSTPMSTQFLLWEQNMNASGGSQ